jgi:TolB-like protein/Flp pilus assembly protein TadD
MSLAIGTLLGPYEVLAPLGAGGMGEVYRAKDPRLGREVAIKVLPASFSRDADRLRRFEQEAKAAGILNHPNITAVYDIGQHDGAPYVVQELLEGETLRSVLSGGRLSPRKAIDYAIQIAHGLAAAHEKGIIHRDLKPENLFIAGDDRIKILDFGLAKLTRPEPSRDAESQAPTRPAETEPGVILGTLSYMSPEQVRGQPADPRSDLFSLGAVLYEMLMGRRAFSGSTPADTMSAVLKEEPPDLHEAVAGLAGLDRIVSRCLQKRPESRFQSARDLAFALEETAAASALRSRTGVFVPRLSRKGRTAAIGAGLGVLILVLLATRPGLRRWLTGESGRARIVSVAVLPLRDVSGAAGQEYFVDGMTEALTASLAQIGALKVISGTSAMQYKGTKKPLRQIARELGVDAVLEGSVARVGERVRITAQLIHAESDTHLWAKSLERDLRDVLALQGEVAREVARQIETELTAEEQARLAESRRIDSRAYEAYLLGRFFLGQGTEDGLKKAMDHFTRSLEIDQGYAAAHAGIANYYAILPFYSRLSPAEVLPKARAAAQRSLKLDDNLAEAHASLAYVLAYYEWDWTAAEREFRRAIALRPSSADAHFSYSRFLAAAGRPEEAIAEIRRAQELDPRSLLLKANRALLSYFRGQYDDALEELLEIRRLDPNFPVAPWGIGLAYEQKGMLTEAIAAIRQATSLSKSLNFQSSLGHALALSGRSEEARAILDRLGEQARQSYVPSYFFALIHAGLGEKDRAMEWLERAYQERSTVLAYLRLDPRLAALRSDPRFSSLLQRIGVPPRPNPG